MDAKIIIATHKKYWMPDNPMYIPLHVGKEGKKNIGYIGDNTGDNISKKNANYCELTGLYWAWKNLKYDYLGIVHYRRHFTVREVHGSKRARVLNSNQLEKLLKNDDILLPRKRNYLIETNYTQYVHAHHKEDLDITREIIVEKYPEYLVAFDDTMKRTTGHRFNMFIMKREYADDYCKWMFDILFELENRLDISSYSPYDARVFGFVSERLLDIWLETKGYEYKELPYIFMESQNWWKKGKEFLKRKFS